MACRSQETFPKKRTLEWQGVVFQATPSLEYIFFFLLQTIVDYNLLPTSAVTGKRHYLEHLFTLSFPALLRFVQQQVRTEITNAINMQQWQQQQLILIDDEKLNSNQPALLQSEEKHSDTKKQLIQWRHQHRNKRTIPKQNTHKK